ncbi:hypothetical protein HH310_08915 [Actinoplanes sp. TBRC 11911]|uniref:hypothetical protein n=1 Tax=Actinoplanes sp. TBRC 11911 TaxID=2729386 RepID=UPI00145EB3DF|nr:hypothetical protein [Actinoplanes sp. TBRC 11911]NMO51308.1 hypothetical protein [Actinoplanes sp. TBRC 11911]
MPAIAAPASVPEAWAPPAGTLPVSETQPPYPLAENPPLPYASVPAAVVLPTGWIVAAGFLIGLSALMAVTSVIYAVLQLNLVPVALSQVGSQIFLFAIIGLIVASNIWRRSTRQLVDAFGGDGRQYAAHWGYRVYVLALFGVIFVQVDAGLNNRRAIIAVAVLRCVAALGLIGGVLHTWARIHRLLAGLESAAPARVHALADAADIDWNAVAWDPDLEDVVERQRRRRSS